MSDNDPSQLPANLDAWVRQTWPHAIAYARSLLRSRSVAEDIVQDCYCNLLRKAGDYDLLRDGTRLLMKSVSNACFKRNARTRPTLSLSDATPTDSVEPHQLAANAELESAIESALADLPQMQRAAVELKSLGHSLQEIADILGVSATNAGVLIHRGRQELARLLAPYLEGQGK